MKKQKNREKNASDLIEMYINFNENFSIDMFTLLQINANEAYLRGICAMFIQKLLIRIILRRFIEYPQRR